MSEMKWNGAWQSCGPFSLKIGAQMYRWHPVNGMISKKCSHWLHSAENKERVWNLLIVRWRSEFWVWSDKKEKTPSIALHVPEMTKRSCCKTWYVCKQSWWLPNPQKLQEKFWSQKVSTGNSSTEAQNTFDPALVVVLDKLKFDWSF